MRKAPSLIKVRLTNSGDATEMPWAQDLGRTPGGARKVRLANVPFMHARPTWGDVIAVAPAADGVLTWDRRGLPFEALDHLILETGGRWALIIDVGSAPGRAAADPLAALTAACVAAGYVCEGAYAPRPGLPGRAYLAVPEDVSAATVMATLRGAVALPLTLFHPPAETATAATTQAGRSQPGRKPDSTPTPTKATTPATPAKADPPATLAKAVKPAKADDGRQAREGREGDHARKGREGREGRPRPRRPQRPTKAAKAPKADHARKGREGREGREGRPRPRRPQRPTKPAKAAKAANAAKPARRRR